MRRNLVSGALALVFLVGALSAEDIPLRNWTVPTYRAASSSGGYSTMVDISPGVSFVPMQPCRLVDTRGGGVFTGAYGPPNLNAGQTRAFDLNSAPHCTGIPAGVEAYSLNFTVTQTAGAPGDIRAWPSGSPPVLLTSILNWTVAGATLANGAIIPAGAGGSIDVQVAGAGTHLLIDINGYFTDEFNLASPGNALVARSDNPTGAIHATNTAPGGGWALWASVLSSTAGAGSAAVRAEMGSTGSGGVGVWASQAGSGWGVFGETPTGLGVHGQITSTSPPSSSAGVRGTNNGTGANGVGVWGSHAGSGFGVLGHAPTGFGVVGTIATNVNDRAGVFGDTGFVTPAGAYEEAGVRGEGKVGVLGISGNFLGGGEAVAGSLVDGFGAEIRVGSLGTSFGTDPGGGGAPWAVFGFGDIGATGTKHFLDPHPSDPNVMIAYVSLEGPEAGTYFRGRGKFQNGIARIAVPEHFRVVTDPEGLTVQITPIGGMASVGVIKMDLNEIVVQSSRNLEFSYLVQGVRATFKDISPYRTSGFMPRTADAKIPGWLNPAQKRLLIQNGTYSEDGVVNMDTARRLGWDKIWEERSRPAPQPAEP